MNEERIPHNDEIRQLLVEAGPPMELPADDLDAIRRAARREWKGQSVTPIFEGRSSRTFLAMAASLVLLLTAVWLYRSDLLPFGSATVATVELLRGDAGTDAQFGVGDEVAAGTELTTVGTAESTLRMALRMSSGHSVRLDADSTIHIASATRLELVHGAVYVDSGAQGAAAGLEIVTPMGTVREVGTQYEVRVNSALRVRVREGSVSLSHSGQTFSASRGEQLTVDRRGVDRSAVVVTGPDWTWVLDTAPSFDIEGSSLEAYLEWISRETGWQVRYDDASLESKASEIAYGSIENLTPEQSLSAVLPSYGLGHRLEDGTLVVMRSDS